MSLCIKYIGRGTVCRSCLLFFSWSADVLHINSLTNVQHVHELRLAFIAQLQVEGHLNDNGKADITIREKQTCCLPLTYFIFCIQWFVN